MKQIHNPIQVLCRASSLTDQELQTHPKGTFGQGAPVSVGRSRLSITADLLSVASGPAKLRSLNGDLGQPHNPGNAFTYLQSPTYIFDRLLNAA